MRTQLLSEVVPDSIDELIEILLTNRGIRSKKERTEFLFPTHPMKLRLNDVGIDEHEMKKAVVLVQAAKKKKLRVLVFGDYDADGVCSTAVMWEALHLLGCKVLPFIPHRERHGYGLTTAALNEILDDPAKRPELVITVDNGIVAHAQIERLKKEGIKVIVTDHHQPETHGFPKADAVVHTTKLCGATTGWFLARELHEKAAERSLDLCGIATIADQVPLLKANRSFATYGIVALQTTTRPGLRALYEAAGLMASAITAQGVNFAIAPRLNAMGRMSDPKDALRLLCSTNAARVRELATKLQSTNLDRQDLTAQLIETADRQRAGWKNKKIVVAHDESFHHGVIGLVAGRLAEKYWKPAVVIATGTEPAKGSARSIPGVNIVELLRKVRNDLVDVGGHPMAAGFSVQRNKIETFKKHVEDIAAERIADEQLIPVQIVECVLPWELATVETAVRLTELEPFGSGNPAPRFLFRDVGVRDGKTVGRESTHYKFTLHSLDESVERTLSGIVYYKTEVTIRDNSLVGKLKLDTWRGRTSLTVVG